MGSTVGDPFYTIKSDGKIKFSLLSSEIGFTYWSVGDIVKSISDIRRINRIICSRIYYVIHKIDVNKSSSIKIHFSEDPV